MKFYDEHNNLIDNNSIEKPEQDLVNNNFIKIIEGHQNVWIKKNN